MKTFFGTVIVNFCFVAGRAKPWFIFLTFISCGLVECAFWKLCFALLLNVSDILCTSESSRDLFKFWFVKQLSICSVMLCTFSISIFYTKMWVADSSHFGRSLIFCDFVIPCYSVSDCVFNENVRRAWPSEKSRSRSLISKSDMRGNPYTDEIV